MVEKRDNIVVIHYFCLMALSLKKIYDMVVTLKDNAPFNGIIKKVGSWMIDGCSIIWNNVVVNK